jgi:hypothetical protein
MAAAPNAEELVRQKAKELFPDSPEDQAYVLGLAKQESGFNPAAYNKLGDAYGLFQFAGDMRNAYGMDTTSPVEKQLEAGGDYLKKLHTKHGGDWTKVLGEHYMGLPRFNRSQAGKTDAEVKSFYDSHLPKVKANASFYLPTFAGASSTAKDPTAIPPHLLPPPGQGPVDQQALAERKGDAYKNVVPDFLGEQTLVGLMRLMYDGVTMGEPGFASGVDLRDETPTFDELLGTIAPSWKRNIKDPANEARNEFPDVAGAEMLAALPLLFMPGIDIVNDKSRIDDLARLIDKSMEPNIVAQALGVQRLPEPPELIGPIGTLASRRDTSADWYAQLKKFIKDNPGLNQDKFNEFRDAVAPVPPYGQPWRENALERDRMFEHYLENINRSSDDKVAAGSEQAYRRVGKGIVGSRDARVISPEAEKLAIGFALQKGDVGPKEARKFADVVEALYSGKLRDPSRLAPAKVGSIFYSPEDSGRLLANLVESLHLMGPGGTFGDEVGSIGQTMLASTSKPSGYMYMGDNVLQYDPVTRIATNPQEDISVGLKSHFGQGPTVEIANHEAGHAMNFLHHGDSPQQLSHKLGITMEDLAKIYEDELLPLSWETRRGNFEYLRDAVPANMDEVNKNARHGKYLTSFSETTAEANKALVMDFAMGRRKLPKWAEILREGMGSSPELKDRLKWVVGLLAPYIASEQLKASREGEGTTQ